MNLSKSSTVSPVNSLRLLLVFLAAVLFAGCGEPKLDAPAAASKFFDLLAKGETKKAYESAAFSFQSMQTLKSFEYTAQAIGFKSPMSVTWTRQVIGEREAKLDGEIDKGNGVKQPIAVTMIYQSGAWRLHALRTLGDDNVIPAENLFTLVGKGASFNDAYRRAKPPEQQIRKIVEESVLDFNAAVQKGSFSDFYQTTSLAWQAQLTERKLQNAFQPFIDAGAKLDEIRGVEAVFDTEPEINGEGLLVVSGYYPTKPYRIIFSMKFIYELPNWKLFGLDIKLAAQ